MSIRKNVLSWGLIAIVLALIGAAAYYVLLPQIQPHVTVHIGDGVFAARVARTNSEREKGLSGTHDLRSNQAMLFVYDTDDEWSIWMKEMNYPIDIIWLD